MSFYNATFICAEEQTLHCLFGTCISEPPVTKSDSSEIIIIVLSIFVGTVASSRSLVARVKAFINRAPAQEEPHTSENLVTHQSQKSWLSWDCPYKYIRMSVSQSSIP